MAILLRGSGILPIALSAILLPSLSLAQQCERCGSDCESHCRPSRIKIINRINRSVFSGFPAAPPQGFAVASVPSINITGFTASAAPATIVGTASVPSVVFQAGSTQTASASVNADAMAIAFEAGRRAAVNAAAASAAAASQSDSVDDPGGAIRQLQQDVKDLKGIVRDLADIVKVHDKLIPPAATPGE